MSLRTAKSAVEMAMHKSFFPDDFEPRPIRSKWHEGLADTWGLGREWQATERLWRPVPVRGASDYLLGLLAVKKNDPGLAAYSQAMDLKFRFKEHVLGEGGSSDFYSPKSDLARQMRLARRFGDEKAEKALKAELREMGVSPKEIRERLQAAEPLAGLSRKNERAFKAWLTPEQRRLVSRAGGYYRETFR